MNTLKKSLSLLTIGLLASVVSFAQPDSGAPQQAADEDDKEQVSAVKTTDNTDTASAKTGSKKPPPDFTPTEEISEDLSVPFPVDI